MQTAVLCTLTLSLHNLKIRKRWPGTLVPHGHESVKTLFVRHLAVTEEANKLRFLATLTLSAHLAGVGQVACVSWSCECAEKLLV